MTEKKVRTFEINGDIALGAYLSERNRADACIEALRHVRKMLIADGYHRPNEIIVFIDDLVGYDMREDEYDKLDS